MNVSTLLNIQLPQFEGPLGLLLYLIRKEEMDIMNIQIHKITNQYMEYIKLMKELDLELAGEFVAMAATLIQIKSRMLLPQYNENGEVVENEDPRKELVQRLLEYQKYQEAARSLYERPLLGRDVWSRGLRERLDAKDEEIVLEENPVFALISAFQSAMRSVKKKVHMVAAKLQSVAGRILEIKDRLIVGQKIAMSDLINDENKRRQILITFLSILELGKMGFVSLFQSGIYKEIYVEAKKPVQTDVLSKVEEYDNIHSHVAAASIIEEAETSPEAKEDRDNSVEGIEFNMPSAEIVESPVAVDEMFVSDENVHSAAATDEEIALAEKELNLDESGV
jgi:segregation and condensation protein A